MVDPSASDVIVNANVAKQTGHEAGCACPACAVARLQQYTTKLPGHQRVIFPPNDRNRGYPLVYASQYPPPVPIWTVESYSKWYALFCVHPDGTVTSHDFGVLEPLCTNNEAPYLDHAPNPVVCARLGEWDEAGFDMVVGRWVQEYEGRSYPQPDEDTP